MTNNLEDSAVKEWLSSQKSSTRATYQTYWKHFFEFAGLSGTEVLESRRADKNFSWERKVIEFKSWMVEKGYASYTATAATMAARSFFEFHRCHLEFRSQESAKITKRVRLTEDYRFSLEDLAKMFAVADLNEKYVLTAGKSFGLRAGDFLRLARGDLEPYIDKGEPPISIGSYKTQKEGIVAYPFIDTDALEIIRLKLDQIAREGRIKVTDRMLPYSFEVQLSRVIKRLVVRAGIKVGTKQVRFHCMRKFLIDRLSSFMSESKWKLIIGKSISESAYVSPDSLREDYQRAMSETSFTKAASGDMEMVVKKQIALQTLKNLGISESDVKKLFKRKPQNLAEEIEEIEKLLEEKNRSSRETDDSKACTDEAHCGSQKIVSEENLTGFLTENWKVIASLPSGKIVIERS